MSVFSHTMNNMQSGCLTTAYRKVWCFGRKQIWVFHLGGLQCKVQVVIPQISFLCKTQGHPGYIRPLPAAGEAILTPLNASKAMFWLMKKFRGWFDFRFRRTQWVNYVCLSLCGQHPSWLVAWQPHNPSKRGTPWDLMRKVWRAELALTRRISAMTGPVTGRWQIQWVTS
jgi:hypothetical protein